MLMHALENQIFRKVAPRAIKYLAKPDLNPKQSLSKNVMNQCAKEFQLAPPVTIHNSDPELMAAVWSAAREAYVVNFKDRAMREAVAAAISEINECPYCVTVHSSLFASAADDDENLDKISQLPKKIASAYRWAAATLSPHTPDLTDHGLLPEDIPQIMGTAVVYHYLNRVVSVFLDESPVAISGMSTNIGQKMMRASFTFFGSRFARLDPAPGKFMWDVNPSLPEEFSWAQAHPNIKRGLAQLAFAAQNAGEQSIPAQVRALVREHLSGWNGEHPSLSRAWLEDIIAPLGASEKPAARLALLTARAPWQIDKILIDDFRKTAPGDKELLQTVAWASFAATQRIASWF